jgi:hypothetical protein
MLSPEARMSHSLWGKHADGPGPAAGGSGSHNYKFKTLDVIHYVTNVLFCCYLLQMR